MKPVMHDFVLNKAAYGSAEIGEMVGRNKSRIDQLAREFNLGEKKLAGRLVYREFPKKDVRWLMNWFATNGQPRSQEGKNLRDMKFKGKDRFRK
jgi:hypothetical protein